MELPWIGDFSLLLALSLAGESADCWILLSIANPSSGHVPGFEFQKDRILAFVDIKTRQSRFDKDRNLLSATKMHYAGI